jgi:predicted permease
MVKFGWNRFIPGVVMSPLELIAACALPLAMFIVGGNIAAVHLRGVDKKAMSLVLLGKLIVLPALGLWLVLRFQFPQLMGLLILMQLAMPPATSLSVITRHYHQEDLLVSQGIFFGHIFSLFTIPLFLSLYFSLVMIK